MTDDIYLQTLYDEPKCPPNFPNMAVCCAVAENGQKLDIIGENISLEFDMLQMRLSVHVSLSLWIIDCYRQTVNQYRTNFGVLQGEILNFYMLSHNTGVLLEYCISEQILKQHFFIFNHNTKTASTELCRNWALPNLNAPKTGLGGKQNGKLVLIGRTNAERFNNETVVMKLLPSNPLSSDIAVDLSAQLNRLNQMITTTSTDNRIISIWFDSQPLVNEDAVHILLTETILPSETLPPPHRPHFSHVGYISLKTSEVSVLAIQPPV